MIAIMDLAVKMMIKKKVILALISFLFFTTAIEARGTTEKEGDFLMVALPISALLTTIILKDKEGSIEFIESFSVSEVSTYALKRIIKEHRPKPYQSSPYSFPSGHTSASFVSAAFIHKRYGFKYAIVPYMLASYVAYSRVNARKHFIHDVIAGAILGIVSSWSFTKKYNNFTINPYANGEKYGIGFKYCY